MNFYQFTYHFFTQLRHAAGLSLTIDDYHLLIRAMEAGLAMDSKQHFIDACQLLWGKSEEQNALIAQQFEAFYHETLAKIFPKEEPTKSKQSPIQLTDTQAPKTAKEPNIETDKPDPIKDKPATEKTERSKEANQTKEKEFKFSPLLAYYPPQEADQTNKQNLDVNGYNQFEEYLHSPFILTNDFLPITQRQMQQIWRSLRLYAASSTSANINWKQTALTTAKQGFFTKPIYHPNRVNKIQVVLLIDHQGSMIGFTELARLLVNTLLQDGAFEKIKVYYTHNIPNKYMYDSENHTQAIPISDALYKFSPKHTVFVFFSDAGAARGLFNVHRVIATNNFISKIQKQVRSMVWFNPMPQHRWNNTSTELIKLLVPAMYECTELSLKMAMKTLKTGK